MKVPYSWLTDWVDVPWDARELGARLTMAGFELDGLETAAPAFTGVVVAEIISAERHPQADKLQVCNVATGMGDHVQIVCGAANARAGLKSALAIVGAKLPGDLQIKAAKLRGVESFGMLASARELGLAESSAGILELPADAPVGKPLREYLRLDDYVLELNITPNRGDAMSVIGIAREVAALTGKAMKNPLAASIFAQAVFPATQGDCAGAGTVAVHVDAPAACPTFVGCVIQGVNNKAVTPIWLKERLRRAGVRSISPIVDVTNYVMLELGQPMHAYDLARLRGEIRVRLAKDAESITLLDGKTIEVQSDVLLITDAQGPVGLAGVMGGQRTAVSDSTTDVFFEVAYFAPAAVTGRGRRWGLVTDASQRYERGVDPIHQHRAMDRAISLLQSVAGGSPSAVHVTHSAEHQPTRKSVSLRRSQLQRLLGVSIADDKVVSTLSSLQLKVETTKDGWTAVPPAHRFDIAIEPDLIEEVARIVGFDAITEVDAQAPSKFRSAPEENVGEGVLVEALAGRGYEEAITFAFVDPDLQKRLFPDRDGLLLANPIASDLAVMRVSLWPGLVRAALENQRRQQDRIRLFEHGATFLNVDGKLREVDSLAGIAVGPRFPEQWGVTGDARTAVDFYDVKGDVESLLVATGDRGSFEFVAPSEKVGKAMPACLHPGRAAAILRAGTCVGWLGELHPSLVREMDFTYPVVLFDVEMNALSVEKPRYAEISRYPQVRRDLAIVVAESVSFSAIADRVTLTAESLLSDLRIFDVYRGPGVETGTKSIALGLIFQDISRTLTDEDVEKLIASIVSDLRTSVNARIRE